MTAAEPKRWMVLEMFNNFWCVILFIERFNFPMMLFHMFIFL